MLDINKIYNEDCLKGMKRIPNESIDMILTDPPYLMNFKSNRRVVKKKFDYIKNDNNAEELIADAIKDMYRVLKNDSSIFMFCSWHHIDFFKQEFEKYFKLKNIIVWEKNNHGTGDLKGSYAPKYELVLFGEKGRNTNRRKRREDIMKYDKIPSSKLLHPTEKNVSMLEDFILDFSDEKDIILDPFMGSGSTAIACINTNRRYIGFELDKNYYDITNNRIQNILKEGR